MKNRSVFFIAITMLSYCIGGLQAQNQTQKLDQVKLMKQLIGKWKADMGKDTLLTSEYKEWGTGIDGTAQMEIGGKLVMERRQLFGYNSKTSQFTEAEVTKGADIELWVCWWTSETRMVGVAQENLSLGEKAPLMVEILMKPGKAFQQKVWQNGKMIFTKTMVGIKRIESGKE
jgi:hypothetical protein